MSFFLTDENVDTVKHSLWNERYRPVTLDNYIGNDSLKEFIQECIDANDIPHLLLHGRAGTGKTTLGKLIVANLDCDFLYVNASDENSVDTVRTKIRNFASSASFRPLKIIMLDEFDFISLNAQAALRNLMETFSSHTRFILTCNYVEKVIDPIRSRCNEYAIHPPSRKEIAIHLAQILTNESVAFDPTDIKLLVESGYPDIRRIVNAAQRQSKKGVLKIDRDSVIKSDFKLQLLEILKAKAPSKKKFNDIRQLVADHKVRDFTDTYTFLFQNVDDFAEGSIAQVILVLSESQYRDAMVVDSEICFIASIVQILSEIGG